MITEANIPALMRCVTNNEKASDFYLGAWSCGTHGCLVGNDALAIGVDRNYIGWGFASDEYGLGYVILQFLFGTRDFGRSSIGIELRPTIAWLINNVSCTRDPRDRTAALNRLRKFIYYVLRKRELLYDDSGCVRETARRAEGDHHIVRGVLRDVQEATLSAA